MCINKQIYNAYNADYNQLKVIPGGVSDHLEVVQMIGWTGCIFQGFSLAAGMVLKGKSLAAGAIWRENP